MREGNFARESQVMHRFLPLLDHSIIWGSSHLHAGEPVLLLFGFIVLLKGWFGIDATTLSTSTCPST